MGVNARGVVAAVLNRAGSLGPAAGNAAAVNCRCSRWRTIRPKPPRRIVALDAADGAVSTGAGGSAGAVFVRGLGYGHAEASAALPACTWSQRTTPTIQRALASPCILRASGPLHRPARPIGAPGRTSLPIASGDAGSRSTLCRAAGLAPSVPPCWRCHEKARPSGCSPPVRRTRRRSSRPGR